MTKAKIYKPAKNAMQSGQGKSNQWVFEYVSPTGRLPEALMGWVSSGDTLNQVKIKFDSADAAVKYAQKAGVEYVLSTAHARKVKPRNYGDNFKYIPVEEGA